MASSFASKFVSPSWAFIKRWWIHTPLVTLLLYIIVSQALGENYPFSHYPMYSNPSPERPYFSVTDAEGNPFPIATLTGITSPKVGKIFRKKADDYAEKKDTKSRDLKPEDLQVVGSEIFIYLREQAAIMKQKLPDKLQLRRNEIGYSDGKIVETSEIFAQE